jgi:hypothetical protein
MERLLWLIDLTLFKEGKHMTVYPRRHW